MNEVGVRIKVAAAGLENIGALNKALKDAGVDTAALDAKAAELAAELARLGTAEATTAGQAGKLGTASREAASAAGAQDAQVAALSAEIARLGVAQQAAVAQLNQTGAAHRNAASAANSQAEANTGLGGGVGGVVKGLGALYASVQATVGVFREWLTATVALDQLRRVLTTVTGSGAEAEKQIEFLRVTAQKTGQSFTQISGEYGKFVASAAASGIPLATVQKVFVGVSAAAGQLGLSSERTSLILGALGQMASKGTVGMEELRQQLGDSLPGALSLLAKGLGLTDAELIKLVESGGLLARDALPALGTALTQFAAKGGKDIDGLTANWYRFKNTVDETGTVLAAGATGKVLAILAKAIVAITNGIAEFAVRFDISVNNVLSKITLLRQVLNGNIDNWAEWGRRVKGAIEVNEDAVQKLTGHIYKGADATKAMGAAATATAPAITAQGAALQQTGTAAQGAAAAQTQAAQATTAAGMAAQGAAAAQTQAAQATAAAGAVAVATGTQWYSLKVAYDANITSIEKTAKIAGELVKAKQEEGKAAESLAKLTGNENEIRVVAAKVAADNAAAVRDEADAVSTHAAVLAAEHAALLATAKAEKDLNDDRKKQLATLQDLIDKTSAEAEKLNQTARAQELAAAAAKQAVEIAKDNTFRHGEFALAVDRARVALQAITIEMKAGRASSDDYERAILNLKNAQGLLRDAVLDADKYLKKYLDSKKADTDITINGLRLKLEEAKTLERFAQLHGLETQALQAEIVQKRLELDISRATAKAKADEADETIRLTLQTKGELQATGDLTPEKQYELDLRIQNAQAKKLEAAAGLEASKSISEEISALQGLTAAKRAANSVPTPTGAPVVNAPAANAGPEPAKLNAGDYVGSDGKTRNSRGEVIGSIIGTYDIGATAALQIKERNGTLSASDLALAQTAADAAKFNAAFVGKSGAFSLNGARDAAAQVLITQRLLEAVQQLATPSSAGSGSSSATGTPIPTTGLLTNNGVAFDPNAAAVQAAAANQAAGTTGLTAVQAKQAEASTHHTVTISLPGGRTSTIAVSTALDGTALTKLLDQLARDMARAGG